MSSHYLNRNAVTLVTVQLHMSPTDAFDTDLMKKTLEDILDCKTVRIPVYDFKTHSRSGYSHQCTGH